MDPRTDQGPYTFELLFVDERSKCRRFVENVSNENGFRGSLVDLAPYVARNGGNIAPGIGDYAYPELGAPANHEIIRQVVDIAKSYDREVATPDDVRKILRLPPKAA